MKTNQLLGQFGSKVITDATHTADMVCLVAVTEVTITSLAGTNMTGFNGLVLPSGAAIFGRISSVTITGTAIAYFA